MVSNIHNIGAIYYNTNFRAGMPGRDTHLSEDQKQQVNQLQKRNAEVKAHEQAHMAAGGGIVQGGAAYQYQNGPDGKQYAVGGEVKIDLSSENSPDATIRKMQQVRRAALAPAEPSGTDRAVAAQATQIETKARMERTEQSQEDLNETSNPIGRGHSSPGSAARSGAPGLYSAYGDFSPRMPSLSGQRLNLMV
jgi:hypothetical protein